MLPNPQVPGPAGTPDAEPPAPPGGPPRRHGAGRRRPARRHRTRWIVAAVALGLAVIATIPLVFVPLANNYRVATNPVDTVRAYFQALADRDADRARALLTPFAGSVASPPAAQQAEQQMLSARTLRDPGYTPPKLVKVAVVPAQRNNPTVRAQFDVASGRQEMLLQLSRSGTGPFAKWLITNGLVGVELPDVDLRNADLRVAGNTIRATRWDLSQVFPGSYQVTLPTDPIREAVPLTVTPNNGWPGQLTVRVRPDVQATVERQVRAYLAGCEASPAPLAVHCPFGVSDVNSVTDIHYKIIKYPPLSFNVDNVGTANVMGTGGQVQITGRYNRPGGQAFTYEYEFVVLGTVQIGDGKPAFTPQS
jgi:hypothetical protein